MLKYLQKWNRGITVINITQAPHLDRWPSQRLSMVPGSAQPETSSEQQQFGRIIQFLKREPVDDSGTEYSLKKQTKKKPNSKHGDAETQTNEETWSPRREKLFNYGEPSLPILYLHYMRTEGLQISKSPTPGSCRKDACYLNPVLLFKLLIS